MQQTLIIRLLADTQEVEWLVQDDQGHIIQGPEKGQINQVECLEECKVWVLVPGADVLLTTVDLPKLSQAKLRKAVPFALEEQLADDVRNLHVALGSAEEGAQLPVAVVSKAKMAAWLDQITILLKNPKCTIMAMLPDMLALELEANTWSVLVEDQRALVRSGTVNGFGCDAENLSLLIQALMNSEDIKPEKINLIGVSELELDVEVSKKPTPPHTLNLFMSQIQGVGLDLLQDEFKVRHQPEQTQQLFKYAGALALACILIITMADIFKVSYLSSRERKLEQRIAVVYKEIFFP